MTLWSDAAREGPLSEVWLKAVREHAVLAYPADREPFFEAW